MFSGSYRFKIGAFECMVVSDGTNAYQNPAEHFFANAPNEHLEQALRDWGIAPE